MVFNQIFLDTNILVDIVANRKPFSKDAIEIFDYCQRKKIKMYSTSISIANLHYIAKKMVDEKELRSIIDDLLDTISIIAITETILRKSLKSSHKDFEDAIQYHTALENGIDIIITRNKKDFKNSKLPVMTAKEYLKK